jgi:hypothetical protein
MVPTYDIKTVLESLPHFSRLDLCLVINEAKRVLNLNVLVQITTEHVPADFCFFQH